jgi:Asp-tRNA(Asn)/Glu-tRNA(Gln) amidotransferase B subunit
MVIFSWVLLLCVASRCNLNPVIHYENYIYPDKSTGYGIAEMQRPATVDGWP